MEYLSRLIAELIIFIGRQTHSFWENLQILNFSLPQIMLDIALVAVVFYFIFSQLKGSRTVHILTGLSILAAAYFISKLLQLVTFGWMLEKFFTVVLVAIPVIFQQELRSGLERLGHTKPFLKQQAKEIDTMINDLVESSYILAKKREGALIAIEQTVPLKEFIDTGKQLNAQVSKEIIQSIFNHQAPLHDGAVIIRRNLIAAASCVLPHTATAGEMGNGTGGTRHKAALGLSESTDALIIVVSEERGIVSFANKGNIERNILPARLHSLLMHSLKTQKHKVKPVA